jgi:hypothetical protein
LRWKPAKRVYCGAVEGQNGSFGFHMKIWSFGAGFWAILIYAFSAAIQVERGACLARHSHIPGLSALFQYAVLFCLIGYWLDVDSRGRGTLRVWDMGFFLYLAWPVILPYYFVKTRGLKRGLFALLLFAIVSFGAFVAGVTMFRPPQ